MTLYPFTLAELERAWIARVVRRSKSISQAARKLGLHRRTLQRKMDKLKIPRSGLAL